MIRINLLPHREEKRKRRKIAFYMGLGGAAAVGVFAVLVWFTVLDQMISNQKDRNQFLTNEITKLETQIKDIATLRAEIDSLKARQKAVEDLQTDRNTPVYLLNELVKQTPEGVYLTSIKQSDQSVAITGIAQTNERVSEFLRNTAYNSQWLERPELIEIKVAGITNNNTREQRRLFDFSMRVSLKRPAPAAAPAPQRPASGAARTSS